MKDPYKTVGFKTADEPDWAVGVQITFLFRDYPTSGEPPIYTYKLGQFTSLHEALEYMTLRRLYRDWSFEQWINAKYLYWPVDPA